MSENDADISDEQILDEFIIRRKRRSLTLGLFILFLALGLPCLMYFLDAGEAVGNAKYLGILSIVFMFVCLVVFEFINWRCPICSRYLKLSGNTTFCPHCKTRLKY
ncbi:MAG: hypothetical protein N3I35_11395 [Clostridia bacterium]|nr:hypothetical protein [Clostridia bacterium]